MRIIVLGCGKIGTAILSSLVQEGHDVIAIDRNPDVIAEISNIYDVMCVCGNGADCDTLTEADVENAELLVAVTNSDEFNMLCCFLARKMGAKHTIARIRNPEYNDTSLGFLRQTLHLSMSINPDYLAAKELYHILKLPGAINLETFSNGNFEMAILKLKESSGLDGVKLSDLRKKANLNFLVCAVQRGDQAYIPDGSFVLQNGDKIGLFAPTAELPKLLKSLGLASKQTKNVMVLGASRTAYYLSKYLLSGGNSVKVIEIDKEKCLEFSAAVSGATVIMGNGAQQELLSEEGIDSTDAFVALTGMDEENILISIFAASAGVPNVIAKVNRPELSSLAEKLGLDCIISPKKIISDILVRYARALQNTIGSNIETLYQLMDGKAEALEFSVQESFKYVRIPLKDMQLRENVLIAGIIRGRKAILPTGDDYILPNDRVIVLSAGHRISDLSDIVK